jgi:phospholipid/cholesterol/gamma-HCH transport system substrate-binding protein
METKANYVAVGIFTLVALAVAFAFVYWTATRGDFAEAADLRIRIVGSASGIGRGSAVLFNGVRVGEVKRVFIDLDHPNQAVADTQVDRSTPITKSTQADIGIGGLTGPSSIDLRGGDPNEPSLFDLADEAGTTAEITARPSAVSNLLESAQGIFAKADEVLSGLDSFVKEVRDPLKDTTGNIRKFSEALGKNADEIDDFLANVGKLSDTISAVSGELDGTLKSAHELLDAVDRDKVKNIVASVETSAKRVEEASAGFDKLVKNADEAITSVKSFAEDAGKSLDKVDALVGGVDPGKVKQAVDDIAAAGQSARQAAEDAAKVTKKVGDRAEDIDKIIADARELAEVDNLLGSDDADGLAAQARDTLASYRKLADTLNSRADTIADGLARFSGQGLRDFEALIRDGRRSVTRIETAITDLERNPQRILSGGEGEVRTYSGRTRR